MSKQTSSTLREMDMNRLQEALQHAEEKLSAEDADMLKAVADAYAYLTELVEDKNTSIAKLRKMLFGETTEKTAAVVGSGQLSESPSSPDGDASNGNASAGDADTQSRSDANSDAEARSDSAPPAKGHGRNGADDYPGAEKIEVPLTSLAAGDPCPKCEDGTIYQSRPGVLVRLTGQPPIGAKIYYLEKLRCNLCGAVFSAEAPSCACTEKYDATAGSMIALLKYGTGMPFNRTENLQQGLGVPLPASTQWDIVEAQAERAEPAFEELVRQAAQGDVVHNDDTTIKILELMEPGARQHALAEDSAAGSAKNEPQRTGMFTSGIVSTPAADGGPGHKIALFLSGRRHAGENLKEVLARRAAELDAPIQMCDALSRNAPTELKTILANCLAHGRRQFVEVAERFPEECQHVLEALATVYHNDALAKERNLSPPERLLFHQAESGSTMEELHAWLARQFGERRVEPNSALGGAISYLLKHWEKLTLFLRVAGAPLDNNVCERALKKAILHRKNALFYKTCHGAHVGDVFMSLIYTCQLCGANAFDYLTELDRHAGCAGTAPQDWMPWNYRQTLDGTSVSSP